MRLDMAVLDETAPCDLCERPSVTTVGVLNLCEFHLEKSACSPLLTEILPVSPSTSEEPDTPVVVDAHPSESDKPDVAAGQPYSGCSALYCVLQRCSGVGGD